MFLYLSLWLFRIEFMICSESMKDVMMHYKDYGTYRGRIVPNVIILDMGSDIWGQLPRWTAVIRWTQVIRQVWGHHPGGSGKQSPGNWGMRKSSFKDREKHEALGSNRPRQTLVWSRTGEMSIESVLESEKSVIINSLEDEYFTFVLDLW